MSKKEVKRKINIYSPEEETWNSITHALGLGFSITGLIFSAVAMLAQANSLPRMAMSLLGG